MAFAARVLADSISPDHKRLRTVLATYPRFIHSEIMTHRDRARNAASSRAIPWKRNRKKLPHESDGEYAANMAEGGFSALHEKCMKYMILTDPVVPIKWGLEQGGMQTVGEADEFVAAEAKKIWLEARDQMIDAAEKLASLGIHKSLCNRLTEPWMWITVVMSATEWNNFFRLRCHPDAEIHFQKIAGMIREELNKSKPVELKYGEWHTPFVDDEEAQQIAESGYELGEEFGKNPQLAVNYISAGRCARVSYLTHDGIRDWSEDIKLAKKLIERPDDVIHASPLEHVAKATFGEHWSGPFRGWAQFRKEFKQENVPG